MASLRSMFGGVDDEVIAMLLQSNNGHLERTVEQLLGITGGGADVGGADSASPPANNLSVPSSSARRRSSNSSERTPGQCACNTQLGRHVTAATMSASTPFSDPRCSPCVVSSRERIQPAR